MTDREAPRRQRRSYGGLPPDTWPRQAVASSPASAEMHSIRVPGTMHVPAPTSSAAVRGGHTDPERRGRGRRVEGHGKLRPDPSPGHTCPSLVSLRAAGSPVRAPFPSAAKRG